MREIFPKGRRDDYSQKLTSRLDAEENRDTTSPNIVAIFWRRKLTIVLALVLGLGCGLAYLSVAPVKYLGSSALLIDPRLGKGIGTDPTQPGFVADTSAIDSQVKLLTSQTVLDRVGTKANLSEVPEFNGSQRSFLQVLQNPTPLLSNKVDLKALEDAITIKRPERTYVVQVDVLARDPKIAATIANAITQAYTADQVSARLDTAEGDNKFVDQRLKALQEQIKQAETKVEAYKTKNNVVTTTGLRSNEQQIADLTKALGDARAKASDAKARSDEMERMARTGHIDSSGEALKSLTMERLRQQQADIERDASKLAMTLGDRHPAVQEARGQLAKIDGLIKAELQRLRLGAAGDYQIARRNEAQIVAQVDRLKSQSNKISGALVPLTQLEHDVTDLRASYDRFAKIRDSVSQQEADSPPARVIAVAQPAVSPSSPKKTIVLLLSLAGGLFFGLAAALFQEGNRTRPETETTPEPFDAAEPVPQSQRARHQRRYWDDGDDDRV